MGTHIDAFFPYRVEPSPKAVLEQLEAVFRELRGDLAVIRERGKFSPECGEWWLITDDDGVVTGEGPSGFSISVFPAVAELTSVERFGALTKADLGIHLSLRRVFEAVAASFGNCGHLAIAAGGFGDTDKASDLALGGAGFDGVCDCLESVIGRPARSWQELEEDVGEWYRTDAAQR